MATNPATLLTHMMGRGANPQQMLQQMATADPRVAQALQMMQGKSPRQLEEMARNMARERGTTVEDVARGLGIPFK